ncbi:hypothetical protein GKZ75_13115 [Kocuria indica]|uniref:Uncharacterized protein n=1 Tax=Kocuria marina subsp. indica TaxID=1049583 RepID=A0A6N9R0S9_9MICC|nr:hypothetical protein [Kocuria indica]NDO79132.1 hypothetical protein [Kocuria indica]
MINNEYLAARFKAASLVGRLMATPEGRKYFQENNYKSGQALITADYAETISSVLHRASRHSAPVTVAIVREDGELLMMSMEPTDPAIKSHIKSMSAGSSATIGMMYDACAQQGKRATVKIGDWGPDASATALPSASRILANA